MAKPLTNIGASMRARLLNLARTSGQPFDLLLTRFVLERLLYRLSQSPHADRFVLKGAMLLTTWLPHAARGTRDLDFLGMGDPDETALLGIFHDVLSMAGDDGVEFEPGSVRIDSIREELKYGGVRLRTTATLAGAKIAVVVDIAFGDAVEPGLETITFPALLDLPSATLRAYARETVIAEKFQAMITLGRANSRMKDFYDIWILSKLYTFDPGRLAKAIAATFARRETQVPDLLPDALTPAFAQDEAKRRQWAAFAAQVPGAPADLEAVVRDIADFLMPHAAAARGR